MLVLEHCDAPDPSACNCCDHAYDAGRFFATTWLARNMRMPWGWSLDEALQSPPSQSWMDEHFIPTQRSILDTGSPRWQNYPIRQAALALAVIHHGPWSIAGRKGAAWATVRAGMKYHHWRLNPSTAETWPLVEPDEHFWETYDDLRVLAELLDRAYYYVPHARENDQVDSQR